MKIKFLIGYPAKSFATEWKDIENFSKSELTPDEDTYILFKALELNKDLDKELIKARKNLHLPENGLSWEEYKKRKDTKADQSKKELEDILFFIRNRDKEIYRIKRKLNLHPQVDKQLNNLILGYFVEPLYQGVGFGTNVDDIDDKGKIYQNGDVESVMIYISKKISKNELHKFVDKFWSEISKLLELLTVGEHFFVSSRDIRIVDLRDNLKMKYKDIVEKIIIEFNIDNLDSSINEDSVKTSYKRAKEKITLLAQIKKR